MKKLLMLTGAAAALFVSMPAQADVVQWYVPATVDLRAGPDASFPVVANIPAQAHMEVQGCVQGWTWCDVTWNGQRGWLPGGQVETTYQDKPSYVAEAGPTNNVPVVTYNTSTYWDNNYRTAPFYTQRERYVQWEQH